MIGIIDWRMAQCAARDVTFHFNTWAEAADAQAISPDVVIVAIGGLPNLELFETRGEAAHVISTWDIIFGDVKPGGTGSGGLCRGRTAGIAEQPRGHLSAVPDRGCGGVTQYACGDL